MDNPDPVTSDPGALDPGALEPGTVYADTRARIVDLVVAAGEDATATIVPACPAWTVHDTVAHVVGIAADLRYGRTEGLGSDAWTAAQVDARRDRSFAEVCEEWADLAPFVADLAARDPWMVTRLVADLVTHEHDLRHALGGPGERDGAAVRLGLQRYGPAFVERAAEAGLAPVAVVAGDVRFEPAEVSSIAVTLHGSPFEVLRALTGRRSGAQVARLDWRGGDPTPYLALVSPYGSRTEDLPE